MSKDKVSSQEITDQVAAQLSVSKRIAEDFLKSLFNEIEDSLSSGEVVKIKNLGTFKMQWNEPRKSVNVQTGEVIIIDGYNKVTFTPDNELKDAVNEPYSHLETVDLDENEDQSPATSESNLVDSETSEGLRNLSEQASEIKDILSEIKALSTKVKRTQPTVRNYEIPDYELILIDEEPENSESSNSNQNEINNIVENTDELKQENINSILSNDTISLEESINPSTIQLKDENKEEESSEVETTQENDSKLNIDKSIDNSNIIQSEVINIETTAHTEEDEIQYTNVTENDNPSYSPVYEHVPQIVYNSNQTELKEIVSSPFILGKSKRKIKRVRFFIYTMLLITGIFGGIYIAYTSSSCFSCWFKYTLLSEENRNKVDYYWQSTKSWFGIDENKKTEIGNKTISNKKIETKEKIELTNKPNNSETDSSTKVVSKVPAQTTDSFDIVFKNRRNYNEFIGEETITEGIRLTTISQQYYGKRDFWVYIYEANRDNIVHPDRIIPGTKVKVPRLDLRLIDKKNPKCLEKARELHDLYVGKK